MEKTKLLKYYKYIKNMDKIIYKFKKINKVEFYYLLKLFIKQDH